MGLRGVLLVGVVTIGVAIAGCSSVVSGHGVAVPRAVHTPTVGRSSSSSGRPDAIESPDGDFSVLLPDGWSDGSDKLSGLALTGYFGRTIDGFAININVIRQPVGNVSLQAFLRATRASVRKALQVQSVTPATPRLIDGEPAFEYTVLDQQVGRALKQRQTLVIRDGNGYVITYTAPLSNFDFYRGDADAILDSWQWG